ncbi:MAG: glycosyltransferase [candidate division Zixibacteria bacterium]|nr:glycosyltransferase [candidate division Zixibacteria bacterium]
MADLTIVTAGALVQPRQQAARQLALITNGVPDFFFDAANNESGTLGVIPHPRIGYLGNARPPFDIDLLAAVFRRRRDWHLVLAGPIDKSLQIRALRALPNVHFLPSRPLEEVPALLRQWDVGLIPFKLNDFSRALNPLKLGEYLACGLPVVATDLPELRAHGDLVWRTPNESAGFEEAIALALAVDRKSHARRAVAAAREITWTAIARRYILPQLEAVFFLDRNRSV